MNDRPESINRDIFLGDDELAAMKKRADAATPGPWKSYVEGREEMSGSDFIMTEADDIYLTGATVADQDFIAHARQDIPRLIAEIERLKTPRRAVERTRAHVRGNPTANGGQ
ncbi:MAG: hypothetical protein EXR07_18845 [Acetobacteraceae bacterium]|nr:hypothetical protein [Acetobacteraceae bacterium]